MHFIYLLFLCLLTSSQLTCAPRNTRSKLDTKLSSSLDSISTTTNHVISDFNNVLNHQVSAMWEERLSATEDRLKEYINDKFSGIEQKLNQLNEKKKIIKQTKQRRKTRNRNPKKQNVGQLAKKEVDSTIQNEVKKQLSFLREDRLNKLEKVSEVKRKTRKRRLLQRMLAEDLDDDLDY